MGNEEFLALTNVLIAGHYSLFSISIFKRYYRNRDDKCEVVFLNRQTNKSRKATYRNEAKFWSDLEVLLVACYQSYLRAKNISLHKLARNTPYFHAKEMLKIDGLFRTEVLDIEGKKQKYFLQNTNLIKSVIAGLIIATRAEEKQILDARKQKKWEEKNRVKQYYAQAATKNPTTVTFELKNNHKLCQELLPLCSPNEPLYQIILKELNNTQQEELAAAQYETKPVASGGSLNIRTPSIENYDKIIDLLVLFKETALSSIKDKRYGIPDSCRINIEPAILASYFTYAIIKESKDGYIAVVNSIQSEFTLNLTEQINNQRVTILQIYLLCAVADIVKDRTPVSPKASGKKSGHYSGIKHRKEVRRYPRGKILDTGNKAVIRKYIHQPAYVPWHFRYIGRPATQSAHANAILYAGINLIPKGFTFVRPYWRGIKPGSEIPDIRIQSQLAQSFTKSLDSIL